MPQAPVIRVHRNWFAVSAVAIALPALAVWTELLLSNAAGTPFVFLVSGPVVAICAWYGGLLPGAVATVIAAAATDYVFLGPGALLRFGSPFEAWALAAFVAGWLVVCTLLHIGAMRRSGDRNARALAERAAARSERVAGLTAALGRARSGAAVIEAALQEPLQALHGDAAMLLLIAEDGASATITRTVGYDQPVDTTEGGVSLMTPGPLQDAVRGRAPVVLESREAYAAAYGERADDSVSGSYMASAVVPLMAAGRVAAVIRMDFGAARSFSSDDHAFLASISAHGGQALERAWEQDSDQRARVEAEGLRERADEELVQRLTIEQALRASETRYRALASRTTRLHALTAALSEAVTTDAVAKAIMQQATVVVGATAGDVSMLADGGPHAGALEKPAAAAPDVRRFAPEPGFCETDVISTRLPVFIRSWDESQERYWRSASAAADGAYSSSAALPLLVGAAAAGVLRFDFSAPVNFDDEYQALLVSVAQHCSQALDRARLYELAQRARAEAEAASRLKDDFLSIVSHELRTPLNAVLGWASMLQKRPADSSLAQRAVQSIRDNATRQAKLIDDLLDVSQIAAGRAALDRQEVDVAAVVGGVVESLIPVAASGEVHLQLFPFPPAVITGDRRRLEQVFFNLLGNALKFTPPGGRIAIDAQVAERAVDIRIRDTGVGIAPEFLPYVFDRFRQEDSTSTRTFGGLGLGLSIAKQLVEAHKGSIAVESDGQGRGTLFTVRLPRSDARQVRDVRADVPARRTAVDPPRLDGTRVLVVDDESDARDVMWQALSHQGADVTTAATAPEAYNLLMSDRFDVLLADIAMPGEDGCSLIRRVRASLDPQVALIPAAAVTAHARDQERRKVLDAGFHTHLVKPVESDDLVRAVSDLARGGATFVTAT